MALRQTESGDEVRPYEDQADRSPLETTHIKQRLLAGAAATAVVAILIQPGWAELIQFVAFASIVPLGLLLIRRQHQTTKFEDLANFLILPAAGAAAVSYLLDPGAWAAVAATPWLTVTILVAFGGLVRFIDRPWPVDHRLIETVSQGFLVVGGSWFWLSRAGLNPMGFSDELVALTGIHFHYAGFAMPLVVAQIGYRRPSDSVNAAAAGVLLGIPLTAFGLTVGGVWEFIGGMTMAVAGLWVAALLIRHASSEKGLTRLALGFAAICLAVGMILAGLYVTNLQFDQGWLSIERMVRTHGSINGFGFGLVALVALASNTPPPAERLAPKHLSAGTATPNPQQWLSESSELSYPEGLSRLDEAPDGYRLDTWSRTLGKGPEVFEAASDAIRKWAGHRNGAGFTLLPEHPQVAPGTELVVIIPLGPVIVYAPSRIVWTTDEPATFGFAYGTLHGHFSSGEESFLVHVDDDGVVSVQIRAIWRPAWWPLKLGGPITRLIQQRSIHRWLDGVEMHCKDNAAVHTT